MRFLYAVAAAALFASCGRTPPLPGPGEATCSNGAKDTGEADVDCGGPCTPCGTGATCTSWADCLSSICKGGTCATSQPACTDGVLNGAESDIDCGGSCVRCEVGSACGAASDCKSGICDGGVCAQPKDACSDGVQGAKESGVDCGGPCPPCPQPPTCSDGVRNGAETDTDCGGDCSGCAGGDACTAYTDCQSGVCAMGTCASPQTCTDAVRNGTETDVDCGGGCPRCTEGLQCGTDGDCVSSNCEGGTCAPAIPSCTDGLRNGNETDVDCGGGTCASCLSGRKCGNGADCKSGVCSAIVLWSDASWKQTQSPGSNWWSSSYDDSGWAPAYPQAPYGQPPWGFNAPMPPATPAWWIWYFDSRTQSVGTTVYFRRTFAAPNTNELTLSVTADDEFNLYVDAVFLGSGNWWPSTKTFKLPVTPFASKTFAVEVKNTAAGTNQPPGPAGLLVDVRGSGAWCR